MLKFTISCAQATSKVNANWCAIRRSRTRFDQARA